MASIQIPNLTAAISVSGAEQMEAVQGGSSVRVTIQQIADLAGSQYGLQPIPDNTILGNLSGVSALPTDYTLSQFLDYYSTTQGAVLYRGGSSWQALAPGANGQVLRTNGTGADVSWYTVPGGGTVQSITAGTNLSVSGSANPITLAGTIDTVMNPAFTTSVTTPSIYGGSSASQTLLIQSTTGVGTSDSIVFKVGNNGAITAMTIASDGTVTIPQAAIDTTSITVPLLIGGTTASSSLTLQSTSGVGTTDSILFKVGNNGATTALTIDNTGASTFGVSATSPLVIATASRTSTATTGAFSYGTNGFSDTNVLASFQSSVNSYNQVTIQNTSSGAASSAEFIAYNNNGTASTNYAAFGINSSGYTGTGSLNAAGYGFFVTGSTDLVLGTIGANAIHFVTNSSATDAMTISSAGVVSIPSASITSLTTPLVIGGTTASSTLTLQSTSGVGTSDAISFKVGNNGATTAMTINTSGQVGIGTTSPAYPLDVSGTGVARINPTTGTNQATLLAQNTGGNFYFAKNNSAGTSYGTDAYASVLWSSGAYPMVMATNGTERMRIDSSGNVGIGTISPALRLDVLDSQDANTGAQVRNANSGTSASVDLRVSNGTNYGGIRTFGTGHSSAANQTWFFTAQANPLILATNFTERMRIDSSGNLLLGTTSSIGTFAIGSSSTTASGQFGSPSTIALKNYSGAAGVGGTIIFGADNSTTAAGFGASIYYSNINSSSSGTNGAICFATKVNIADTSLIERMRIDSSGNVSIGPSGTSAVTNLLTNANITGGTTAYAHLNNGVVQSGVTSTAVSFISSISSAAASFTTTTTAHFFASPAAGGAGSTITNQFGFFAESTLGTQGAATVTNAFGFYGNIASGTNRWNLYMGGTANNYMAGRLGLNSATLTNVSFRNNLTITGSTESYANYTESSISSDVTTAAYAYTSAISLNTASTTSTVIHFNAKPSGTFAGSTITNQYGFFSDSTIGTQGAATVTNAYGFYGNIAAATNKYNFYSNGTANNYFAGYSFGLGGVQYATTSTATNTATLTATQVASGFIVGTPTATASYTLPTAAALDTELSNSPTGASFELVVFTTAAFAITLLTATGWTLVGSMATGATANSFARFRARKTGAGAWSLYRVS